MSLRDITVVALVLILAVMTLRRPWIGVMNWTWLSIMNPHRYCWGFAYSAPLAAIAAASTLLALLFTTERQSPFKGAPVVWLFVFVLWITLCWRLGDDPVGDYAQWEKVMKIYLMTFVALALLHTKQHIVIFVWVTIGSVAILAAKGGLFTVITGGAHRVWGPPGSFIEDNNEFALATIMTIPLLRFLQLQLEIGWKRHAMSAVMLLCAAAAIGSHSRGALLALAAMSAVFWWRSSRKGVGAVIVLVGVVFALPLMPQEWWDRMDTIDTYEQDASAMGRINAWIVATEVAKHKVFGGGMHYERQVYFDLYGEYETLVRAAHSIYFQVLGNHGFIGLFIFLMIWFSTARSAGRIRRRTRPTDETAWAYHLASTSQASLIAYLVGGAFVSLPYFDLPYNLMIALVLAKRRIDIDINQNSAHEAQLAKPICSTRSL